MNKKISLLLLLVCLLISSPWFSSVQASGDGGTVCPGCSPESYKRQSANGDKDNVSSRDGKNKGEITCFNCDQRPCVATKEAWIRLWHKYWGVELTKEVENSPDKEDKK